LYAGDNDFICNWIGVESVANTIQWEGRQQFSINAKYKDINYGAKKCYRNLAFVRFFGAGH